MGDVHLSRSDSDGFGITAVVRENAVVDDHRSDSVVPSDLDRVVSVVRVQGNVLEYNRK